MIIAGKVVMPLRVRIAWLLDYEPTWFPELSSGLAISGWSLAVFVTADYQIRGGAWLLPCLGLAFGPLRWALLLRLWWGPRATTAAFGAAWWSWIICAASQRYGVVPMMGPIAGFLVLDLLTLLRFSAPSARDLLAEAQQRWGG